MPFPHPTGPTGLSYWLDTTGETSYPKLTVDERADVAVVGAGITGVVTAYLLAKAGKDVVVVSRDRVAQAVTGHTTAHLQIVIDTPLRDLVQRVGIDRAKLAWDSQLEAVRLIEGIARDERIDCDLERLDAILYTDQENEREHLLEEAYLAGRIGYAAEEVAPDEVPFPVAKAAIRYADQGKFHPRKFLLALAKRAEAMGVRFYEGTNITELDPGEPVTLHAEDGPRVKADWVVAATQVPFHTRLRMFPRLYPYNSYVVGGLVPRGTIADRLYWDTNKPGYHYTRVEPQPDGRDLVILGGEDRHAGHAENGPARWDALEAYLRAATPDVEVKYRWSAMWYETEDGLPYVGAVPGGPENVLVATGDSGTGMTNGTISALMMTERILGRGTPWDDLYDPKRISTGAGALTGAAKEILHDTAHVLKSPFERSEVESLADIAPGQGAIMRHGLRKLAVCRLQDGELRAVSATCTHAGCTVGWNSAERSWDCPCHGSRFAPDGEVLSGPANVGLEPYDVRKLQEKEREAER